MRNKKIKVYTRVCRRCGEQHETIRDDGVRPYSGAICEECKKISQDKKGKDLRNKNKEEWEKLILGGLKKGEKLFEVELAKRLGCTCFSMRQRLRALSREGKVRISKRATVRLA